MLAAPQPRIEEEFSYLSNMLPFFLFLPVPLHPWHSTPPFPLHLPHPFAVGACAFPDPEAPPIPKNAFGAPTRCTLPALCPLKLANSSCSYPFNPCPTRTKCVISLEQQNSAQS
jgi:hypothetical protein